MDDMDDMDDMNDMDDMGDMDDINDMEDSDDNYYTLIYEVSNGRMTLRDGDTNEIIVRIIVKIFLIMIHKVYKEYAI